MESPSGQPSVNRGGAGAFVAEVLLSAVGAGCPQPSKVLTVGQPGYDEVP
ncbi:hypothetical protein AB0I66_41785 [Streptomyces sp. NPDC050439]